MSLSLCFCSALRACQVAHTHTNTHIKTQQHRHSVLPRTLLRVCVCVCVRSCGAAGKQEQEQDADGAETARQQWREEVVVRRGGLTRHGCASVGPKGPPLGKYFKSCALIASTCLALPHAALLPHPLACHLACSPLPPARLGIPFRLLFCFAGPGELLSSDL